METVSLKLEPALARKMEASMARAHFATKTEFIRAAIREKVESLDKKRQFDAALAKLAAVRGVDKGKERFKSDEAFFAWRDSEGSQMLRREAEKRFGTSLD